MNFACSANESYATASDDPFRSYVLSAWSRICTVLKAEFVPYLPVVMPIVLQAASLDPKLQFMEGMQTSSYHVLKVLCN